MDGKCHPVQFHSTQHTHCTTTCACFGARDPRWGRNAQTGSECPYLTGQIALEFTKGFQYWSGNSSNSSSSSGGSGGSGSSSSGSSSSGSSSAIGPSTGPGEPGFLQGVVTLKHFDANSLENSDGETRTTVDVNVSNYMLQVQVRMCMCMCMCMCMRLRLRLRLHVVGILAA